MWKSETYDRRVLKYGFIQIMAGHITGVDMIKKKIKRGAGFIDPAANVVSCTDLYRRSTKRKTKQEKKKNGFDFGFNFFFFKKF